MNFFTARHYVDLQSPDEAAMDAADAAWDEASARYARHLDAIRGDLPESARSLLETYYLHDADILEVASTPNSVVILVRLEPEPQPVLLLEYGQAAPLDIDPDALPPEHRADPARWLVDEFDVDREGRGFRHSILLSNGVELGIRFQTLRVVEAREVVSPSRPVARTA